MSKNTGAAYEFANVLERVAKDPDLNRRYVLVHALGGLKVYGKVKDVTMQTVAIHPDEDGSTEVIVALEAIVAVYAKKKKGEKDTFPLHA